MTSSQRTSVKEDTPCRLVAENIYQVRLPLPFRLNHVNCYLLRGSDGITLVDTGLNWPEGIAVWEQAFESLPISIEEITQIVLTHTHPDHFGLAGWFEQRTGCPIRMTPTEREQAERIWINHAWAPEKVAAWWDACAVPREVSEKAMPQTNLMRQKTLPHPQHYDLFDYGATIRMGDRNFQVIHAPGHSDGQAVLYDAENKLALSGDQVLMRITPNIGIWPTSAPNPLGRYLQSLEELADLEVDLALPGHRELIEDWQGRLSELSHHHAARLEKMVEVVAQKGGNGATAFDVGTSIFDFSHLSPHEVRFAVAETLAHIEYLVQRGELSKTDEEVWRYKL